MTYKIERLDDFGRGITFIDGKICFVEDALEGEEVDIIVEREKSKYLEASVKEIHSSSKNRKIPECPFYNFCGGCNIMHMSYKAQLSFKENKIKNIIKKYFKETVKIKKIIPTKEFIYRNKVSLKVKNNQIGFYKDKSNNLVNICKCLLCSGAINETIKLLNDIDLTNIDEVVIRSNYKDEVLVCLIGTSINDEYYLKRLKSVSSIVVLDKNKKRVIKGEEYLIDKIGDLLFRVSYNSFFQVNSFGVEVLYDKVKKYANLSRNEKVLDLYCGTGTIGLFLARDAKDVYGIEINEACIKDAFLNSKLNNIDNIDFKCSDVGKYKKKFKNIDLVVVDPPRSGLSLEAVDNVLSINAKKVIYVSCDPVTLARDLKLLSERYLIKEITPVDMFSNTYHVECVCLLMKKKS